MLDGIFSNTWRVFPSNSLFLCFSHWKQLGEDLINRNSHPENLDGKKWENHFKNLYTQIDGDIEKVMKKSDIPGIRS